MDDAENNGSTPRLRLLGVSEPHPCPYLEGREMEEECMWLSRLDGGLYRRLMDRGFRRCGETVYRPACSGCRACVPIRVPVDRFSPSRSQRRVLRRNTDVHVVVDSPRCTREKWRIYRDYLRYQHDGSMDDSLSAFEEFLYCSPTDTMEMTYTVGSDVVAAGIVDVCPDCLSSVYFYFDPVHARRSLGIFGGLYEIEACRRRGLAHWYIGFYVRQCRRMSYKASFRPYELLGIDGTWRTPREAE